MGNDDQCSVYVCVISRLYVSIHVYDHFIIREIAAITAIQLLLLLLLLLLNKSGPKSCQRSYIMLVT